jgi:hypothetical protein
MKQLIEIVLPLVLPTLIYFGYVLFARRNAGGAAPEMPWPWLVGAGAILLGVTFLALALFGGASPTEVYVPPKIINGQVQPGHFEPAGN